MPSRDLIHLAVTLGDPTSIGPEVAANAISKFIRKHGDAAITAFGVSGLNNSKAQSIFRKLSHHPRFKILSSAVEKIPAKPGRDSARISLEALELATESCLAGNAHALVTGPVDKSLCARVDRRFRGHTEYLQWKARVPRTTMMLVGPHLRVSLVTTHLPLKEVSTHLSIQKIYETSWQTYEHLRRVTKRPRIAICALNPHASDNGLFGCEEKDVILPAIRKLQKKGGASSFTGPWPADTIFARASEFDAIICMYHDQALIPLKMVDFFDGVNVTLGLPFLRTSVDHGTAFDIAGKSRASSKSYEAALLYAYRWVRKS